MKKVFYLSTCDTCTRILKQLELRQQGFILQDIKTEKITDAQLNQLKSMTGSFEALFSRTSRKYKERNLNQVNLTESDYKRLILEEYTFLKRPVIVFGNQAFIGSSKQTVMEAKAKLTNQAF